MARTKPVLPVVVLAGLSGSGKSTALNVFEDMGYFCVDGLPASLMPKLVGFFESRDDSRYRGLALGLDTRGFEPGANWERVLEELRRAGPPVQLIFTEAATGAIMRRYATTRRPHPLEAEGYGLGEAVEEERRRLSALRDVAALVMETTGFSVHDLRRQLQEKWKFLEGEGPSMKVHVMSFGFKYGIPTESDVLFDLRFLPNPHFDAALKPLSGQDKAVVDYVLASSEGQSFLPRLQSFLLDVLPLYAREGRYRLTIALGCTGGRHRSVAVAEAVFDTLRAAGYIMTLEHRHIEKG